MLRDTTADRFPGLLAATAMGVYLLLLVGATTAVTDAAASCSGWPACGNGWAVPTTLDGTVAMGHRVVAFVVGFAVLGTTVAAWRRGVERRVRAALAVSLLLYPVQAGIGAVVAVFGASPALRVVHLGTAMAIFVGLLAALAWTLEAETGTPDDAPATTPTSVEPVEPTSAPAGSNADVQPSPGQPATDEAASLPARTYRTVSAYVELTKPRLMWLLVLVAGAAMALAGGPGLTSEVVVATLGGGALAIGASGTFNNVLERDVDRRMARTSDRPIVTDRVPVRNALAFGVALAAASLVLFASVNLLVATLGLAAILFYSVVYTLILKPNTVQNTVIGGAAGALPALIGWAAVTGEVGLGGLALAAVIFLWTPAHFYNLALAYKEDYARGGFPMMPVVRGETATRRHILWYLGATLLVAGALAAVDPLGWTYVFVGLAFGAVFLWAVVRLHYEQTEKAAFRSFHAANAYLGALLFAVIVDAMAI